MKKVNDWERKIVKTASVRLPAISFSITPELEFFSKECNINDSEDFNSFLVENSGLSRKEYNEKIKKFILNLSNIENNKLSKSYRKHRAEKIQELHSKKEVKERLKNYVKNQEYNK